MVYKPLAVRVALVAGFRRALPVFKFIIVVVEAVGMCEIPAGISKGCGKGGKPALWLSMLSIPRHFHGSFLSRHVLLRLVGELWEKQKRL
jgi:hypothetical protein